MPIKKYQQNSILNKKFTGMKYLSILIASRWIEINKKDLLIQKKT